MTQFLLDTIFFQLIIRGNYYAYFKDSETVRHLEKKSKMFINVFIRHSTHISSNVNSQG